MRDELSQLLFKFFQKYGHQFESSDLEQFNDLWKIFYDTVEEEKNMCTIYACFLDPLDAFKYIKNIIQCCDKKDIIQYSDKKLKYQ